MERILQSPLSSVNVQPGQHLCVDSRPGTSTSLLQATYFETNDLASRPATQYVALPFKHSQTRRSPNTRMIDVGNDLRQRVLTSLSETQKLFTRSLQYEEMVDLRNKTFVNRQKQGRLLPLLGIPLVRGPNISQCIGITSGNRLHSSKKKQNSRKKVRQLNGNYKIKSDSIEVPHRESSIHRNSFNSSHEEVKDDLYGNESVND